MVIVLLGAPGCGKGSVSNALTEKYGFLHLSTGDIFRQTINSNTELGLKVKQIILAGKLVDDATTNEVVKSKLMQFADNKINIILDGYPRNLAQAQFLSTLIKVDYVIDIYVPEREIVKRVTGRRICPRCHEIYNIYYKKPKIESVCDHDNELLIQRSDDQEKVVVERFKQYLLNNAPVVDYYKNNNIYHQVNNEVLSKTIDEIEKVCNLKK